MRGRNRLLSEPGPDARWLDAIEREMAELGVAIAAARREWAGLAVALIAEGDVAAPFPAAEIALEGTLEHMLDGHAGQRCRGRSMPPTSPATGRVTRLRAARWRGRISPTFASATRPSRRRRKPVRPANRRRC